MRSFLKTVTFTFCIAFILYVPVNASEELFYLTDDVNHPREHLLFSSEPVLHILKSGYIVDEKDNFLLGISSGYDDPTSMRQEDLLYNLEVLRTGRGRTINRATTFLSAEFTLPVNAPVGQDYSLTMNFISNGFQPESFDLHLIKAPSANTWNMHATWCNPRTQIINNDSGTLLDHTQPMVLSFNSDGALQSIDGHQWNPTLQHISPHAPETYMILDLGLKDYGSSSTQVQEKAEDFTLHCFHGDGIIEGHYLRTIVSADGVLHDIFGNGITEVQEATYRLLFTTSQGSLFNLSIPPTLSQAARKKIEAAINV